MAQQKRRHQPTTGRAESAHPDRVPEIGKRERVAVAWFGVAFLVIAVAGLAWAPSLRILWILMLIFGAATIPQVMLSWLGAPRKGRGSST